MPLHAGTLTTWKQSVKTNRSSRHRDPGCQLRTDRNSTALTSPFCLWASVPSIFLVRLEPQQVNLFACHLHGILTHCVMGCSSTSCTAYNYVYCRLSCVDILLCCALQAFLQPASRPELPSLRPLAGPDLRGGQTQTSRMTELGFVTS